MSHILRTAKKKSTRSAINTLVSRELRFGGYPSRRSRITTAPAGEIEQGDEGGGLEGGQSAWGGVVFGGDTYHGRPFVSLYIWGKYFQSNVRDMLLSLTLGPKMVRAM